jgi:hypothetical protein
MITHYRNRAFKQLGISFSLLLFTLIFCVGLHAAGFPKALVAVSAVITITFAFVFYVQGNIALAEAKGHDGSVVAAIIIVACLCLGGLFFAMPLILLFGLNDKTKVRRHSRTREHEPARRNPPAKLPPLRNDNPD